MLLPLGTKFWTQEEDGFEAFLCVCVCVKNIFIANKMQLTFFSSIRK